MRYQRPREEIVSGLRDQLAALARSCEGFDAGDMWEGPRIATAVTNIANDGNKKTRSILTQLGMRSQMYWVSYALPNDPHNAVPWIPLTGVSFDASGTMTFVPNLDRGQPKPKPNFLLFETWWKEAVFENRAKQPLSRMDLTLALRSMDGGSHFDGQLPISTYLELKHGNAGFYKASSHEVGLLIGADIEKGKLPPGAEELPHTAHLATMRHIAFELQQSIDGYLKRCGYDSIEQLQ